MAGREWYYYFLTGGTALLLVVWLLYEYLKAGAADATDTAAATESDGSSETSEGDAVSAAQPSAPEPSAQESAQKSAQANEPAASPARALGASAVAASAKRHVVVTPIIGGPAGEPAAAEGDVVEGFVTSARDMADGPGAPRTDFRPCEVYFTDNVKTCDGGEYKYHAAYYEEKLRKVNAAVRSGGGAPTKAQNNLILKYTRMIADYKKFPNAQYCKLPMVNWQQRTADKQPPILSRSERNKDRGPVEHWAYCWRNNATTSPAGLDKTGMIIDRIGGKPAGATFSGTFYVRGKFDESISPAGAVKTYCYESRGAVPEYAIKTALVIQNALKGPRKTKYFRNNAAASVADWDSDTYFREQLFSEKAQRSGSREVVTATPLLRAIRLAKLAKDPCGRIVEQYSTTARVQFTAGIQLAITTFGSGDDYLAGTTTDLAARIITHNATIGNKRSRIATLEAELAQLRIRLAQNTKKMNDGRSTMNAALNSLRACERNPPWHDFYVVVYEHPNYSGRASVFWAGNYGNIWANSGGWFPNDGLSSYIVGRAVNVTFYEHVYFGGSALTKKGATSSTNIWPSDGRWWDNRVSSLRVSYNAYGKRGDPCADQRDAYYSAVNNFNNYSNLVANDKNQIARVMQEIAGLWAEISKYEREIKMMEQRRSEMREAMRSGIERLLSEAKLELKIDDDAAEMYKYLSYDESYIMEL
jgi:hypothetical protein